MVESIIAYDTKVLTHYENLSKNLQKNDSEKPAAQPKNIVDAAIQTDVIERSFGSCQTEISEGMDFQVQVHIKEQSEPIATQTDSTALCDFQVQAIIPREYDSIAVQTIKEEIRMPNIPSSVARTPAKKRKMSSNVTSYELDSATSSTNLASVDVPQPVELIQSGSVDPPSDERVNLESNADNSSALQESQPLRIQSQQSVSNEADTSAEVDDSILNSEVYQIYCQEKDPYKARKKIQQLKACISFSGTAWSFPAEEDFKRLSKSTLNKFWKQKPRSKFEKVKNYIVV